MHRNRQSEKNRQSPGVPCEAKYVEAAKAYFRENFKVQCFDCGYVGRTVPPLNCARCGKYLD